MEIKTLHHLMWRAGFGTDLSIVEKQLKKTKEQLVKELFSPDLPFTDLDIADKPSEDFRDKLIDKDEKQALRKINLEELKDMNLQWQRLLVYSEDQLREKIALFWHDHFACFVPYSYLMQVHVNKLRKHALGSYRDLLHLIAKDAAMLLFLNNTQNRKKHPNENFAREVMELYTLGIGHYTENDIKEAAKAFTGWNYNDDGTFELREKQHDPGPKTFMGTTKNFEGEDILNVLLDHPQTAYFITRKIYAWLVNENVDDEKVKELATFYYDHGYDTSALLQKIFLSDWFYETKNMGTHIKSPVEFLTGLRRSFALDFKDEEVLFFIQKMLGQMLGYPPNVAGWKDGKPWIDSSTLLFRLKLPDHIFNNTDFGIVDKDQAEAVSFKGKFKKMGATVTLDHLYKLAENKPKNEVKKIFTDYFIICGNELAEKISTPDTDDPKIFTVHFIQQLLRQPEYQLS